MNWPDGRPTNRLLRLEEAELIAQAPGTDSHSERMFLLRTSGGCHWLSVRRTDDRQVLGDLEHDDLYEPGLVATALLVPQAVDWFARARLLVPPELRAAAVDTLQAFDLLNEDPELQLHFDSAATSGQGITEPEFRPEETQVLRSLGLLTRVSVDGRRRTCASSPLSRSGIGTVLAWMAPLIQDMARHLGIAPGRTPRSANRRKRPTSDEFAASMALAKDLVLKHPEWTLKRLAHESGASERSLNGAKFKAWRQQVQQTQRAAHSAKFQRRIKHRNDDEECT
ncbi:MAG: hypothetical protein U1F36_08485 [Planctomycetota bacterium]